jgi:hypothetical protein
MRNPLKRANGLETFLFFREGFFYPVEIPPEQLLANIELNPGTLKVEDLSGKIVWQLQ